MMTFMWYNLGTDTQINILNAYGNGPTFDYHKAKIASTISLLPTGLNTPGSLFTCL